ncbi:MAG: FtsX-like permease family protein [Pirellulaceae bacterium]|nr:FtsX-like permease family protein [Pirellulaceae bacterium]
MRTPLALLNLRHQLTRTLVSTSGVAFALLLVFAQLGFMGAVSYTATSTLLNMQFDLLIRSPNYAHFFEPNQVDRQALIDAANVPGVKSVSPFWVTVLNWQRIVPGRSPGEAADLQPIAVMAVDPNLPVFSPPDIAQLIAAGKLDSQHDLIIDDMTQAVFEPIDARKFGQLDIDTEAEIGGQRFRIAGIYRMGTGLAANGSMITNDRAFARVLPVNPQRSVSMGLVQTQDAHPPAAVKQLLQQRFQLAGDNAAGPSAPAVAVLTRQEALQAERERWLWHTPIGLIFQMGVAIALVVGAAIVYMVLATDVTERLPEYATLLALGYSRFFLARIVMTQATLLAGLGFVLAWILAELLYRLATSFSGIPMAMDAQRVVMVLLLGLAMCCTSGLLALRKLWQAEPASLF